MATEKVQLVGLGFLLSLCCGRCGALVGPVGGLRWVIGGEIEVSKRIPTEVSWVGIRFGPTLHQILPLAAVVEGEVALSDALASVCD